MFFLYLLGVVILVFLTVYFFQSKILFYPQVPKGSRQNVQLPPETLTKDVDFSQVWITTSDGVKIHSYLFVKNKDYPTLLMFHGNAGIEYRGFGKSESKPSEKGVKRDAEAALQYLFKCEKIDTSKIIIFGRSLGGAVAIHLAASHPNDERIKAVIVENTFTDITNIPPEMMTQLYKKANSNKLTKIVRFEKGGHNDTFLDINYFIEFLSWLNQLDLVHNVNYF